MKNELVGNDVLSHRSSTSGANIVGDILYDNAVEDEGHSRQLILAFAAKRYAVDVEKNPENHDALYNWALVLQESADNAGPEVGSPEKDALLEDACKKYQTAVQLCPTLHEACDRYDRAVQLNWNSPQALNNWGLALQELGAIVALKEERAIIKMAIRKFRAAIRLRFDFHRAVYNLGTVLVYRGGLRRVRNFLPLPYLRAGWLTIPPFGDPLAPHNDWLRLWFVLDHEALYGMEKVDRKSLAHSYSRHSSTLTSEINASSSIAPKSSVLRIAMEDILGLAPTADFSLPPGGSFCIDTDAGEQYLVRLLRFFHFCYDLVHYLMMDCVLVLTPYLHLILFYLIEGHIPT
nr:protein HLB1-like isoform X1 [Physcomitrium patens]XP_024357285.1 protein HLB1-like isoform X1 [Physcomitrium patens]XP_024357295.1 protein HLB1-like isoform X1 [Physcomitrium patens]XP_024357305.1 protein HLB1-like isoform X1 [Physcomitrium patens]XP_024357313.1 protein HLB1-like isoform X1 [Physcomitrium patens]XP_024357323.1 protein HLB1-like isoform X1 [Physcomitrium patens]XP_024357333.1 protein HLB1-like isoform X1 [Physcomitrium patens]|eukprot:XP_024357282.1 protein HLB1-like isoform X1 [Physcomitrella patens]